MIIGRLPIQSKRDNINFMIKGSSIFLLNRSLAISLEIAKNLALKTTDLKSFNNNTLT